MPKNKDPRNEVGAIIYAVVNRALSDYTAKNIFGNVNYANPITSNPIIEAPSAAIFPYTNAPRHHARQRRIIRRLTGMAMLRLPLMLR